MSLVVSETCSNRRPSSPPSGAGFRIGLLGLGRVGRAVVDLAERRLAAGVDVRCVTALVRRDDRTRPGCPVRVVTSPDDVLADADAIVEVMGGLEPARAIVTRALEAGLPVVSANKTLVAHHGPALCRLARRRRTPFLFEAAVVAGAPFLGALRRRPHLAGAIRIAGVLNGTSHFVLSKIAAGAAACDAVAEAVRSGYAETDVSADLSGRDAAEKLTILLHLLGCPAVGVDQIVPVSIEGVTSIDGRGASLLGGALKPMATASIEADGIRAWVGPAFVPDSDPISRLGGVDNLVRLVHASGRVVTFAGPGAGPEATAETILDDVMEVATGGGVQPATVERAGASVPVRPFHGSWFLRVAGPRLHARIVTEAAGAHGLPVERLLVHADATFALTRAVDGEVARVASAALRERGGDVLLVPVV